MLLVLAAPASAPASGTASGTASAPASGTASGSPETPAALALPAPAPAPDAAGAWSVAGVPPNPDDRAWHAVVHAPEPDRLIVFGGFTERGMADDVWWLDLDDPQAGWETLPPDQPAPRPRMDAAAVWDAEAGRLVVFGGVGDVEQVGEGLVFGDTYLSDVWALEFTDGQTPAWRRLHDGTGAGLVAPSRRAGASAVYDPVGGRLVVFGGNDTVGGHVGLAGEVAETFTGVGVTGQGLTDVWAFDLRGAEGWTRLAGGLPTDRPRLMVHQAVYDPANHQMVVAGGARGGEGFGYRHNTETWSLDLDTHEWTLWSPAGEPPAIADGAWGYSPEHGALLVMAGEVHHDSGVDTSRVHALELGPAGAGSEWRVLPSAGVPHRPYVGLRGTVVVGPDRFVVSGGWRGHSTTDGYDFDGAVSVYDVATGEWSVLLAEAEVFRANARAASAFDSLTRTLYVVGGVRGARTVWALERESGSWRRVIAPGAVPEGGADLAAAFDDGRGRLLVYGDGDGHVWSLDVRDPTARWRRLAPAGDAPNLSAAAAVYDPVRDRLLVLAGVFPGRPYPDYFGFDQARDYNASVFALALAGETPVWRRLEPTGPAPESYRAAVAYDPLRDRLLVFGGRPGGGAETSRTWELGLSAGSDGAWAEVATAGSPPSPRAEAVGVFDPAGDRLLVWGGRGDDPAVHELRLGEAAATWSVVATTDDPRPRSAAAGAWDPGEGRLVVAGGFSDRGEEGIVGSRDAHAVWLGTAGAPPPPPADPAVEAAAPVIPGAGVWQPLGPAGAYTISVALSPAFASDTTAYAGTVGKGRQGKVAAEAAGLFVTHDGGATWAPAGGDVSGAAIFRVAPAPADPARVYASGAGTHTRDAVYVSDDAGRTWRAAAPELPRGRYYGLAVHPTDPDVAWAAGDQGGVFRTDDGGATWRAVGGDLHRRSAFGLAALALPDGGVRLLAATREVGALVTGRGDVFASDDLGESWRRTHHDDHWLTYSFAVDPADPTRVLLAAGDGIWRSDDAGLGWQHVSAAVHAAWLAFDPSSGGDVVYAAGVGLDVDFTGFAGGLIPPFTPGLHRSTDGGRTWVAVPGVPEDEDVGGVAVVAGAVLAASLSSGVHASLDGGATFARRGDGFHQEVLAAVAADLGDPRRLVAAALNDGLAASDDGGATWATSDAFPAWHVAASPLRPGRFLATSPAGVFRSEDGGRTWAQVDLPPPGFPHTVFQHPGGVVFDPVDADTWYVQMVFARLAVTRDNGASFESHPVTGAGCPLPLAADPVADTVAGPGADPGGVRRILVGDPCGGGVFESLDGGATWAARNAGLADRNVTAVLFDPARPGVVWVGTYHEGVFRSDDGGATWRPARAGLGFRYIKDLVVDEAGTLWAATYDAGVFRSDDGAASWRPVAGGLSSRAPLGLSVGSAGVLVATDGAGAFRLPAEQAPEG